MRPTDLNREDLQSLRQRNVLATLWGGIENEKASVVYVSLPHYERRTGNRHEVEVAWLRLKAGSDEIDSWQKELGRSSVTQQALLALSVGFAAMSMKQADLYLAKLSLCQVRSSLKLMETTRPSSTDFQREMERLTREVMTQLEETARKRSVDLNANANVNLACIP